MKCWFMAAPVRGNIEENLRKAEQWTRVLEERFDIVAVANWITGCRVWDESNDEERRAGIERNKEVILRCDAVIAVGPDLTPGMVDEINWARDHSVPVYRLLDPKGEIKVMVP